MVEVFAMTTTPLAWKRNNELARDCPNIRVGLGIHPQIVGTKEADIGLFERLIDEARYVGEIGLVQKETLRLCRRTPGV
jgi:TatD DNase family protein